VFWWLFQHRSLYLPNALVAMSTLMLTHHVVFDMNAVETLMIGMIISDRRLAIRKITTLGCRHSIIEP
jgi:hypothetical protein